MRPDQEEYGKTYSKEVWVPSCPGVSNGAFDEPAPGACQNRKKGQAGAVSFKVVILGMAIVAFLFTLPYAYRTLIQEKEEPSTAMTVPSVSVPPQRFQIPLAPPETIPVPTAEAPRVVPFMPEPEEGPEPASEPEPPPEPERIFTEHPVVKEETPAPPVTIALPPVEEEKPEPKVKEPSPIPPVPKPLGEKALEPKQPEETTQPRPQERPLVEKEKAAEKPPVPAAEGKHQAKELMVKTVMANVRQGPSLEAPVKFALHKGETVTSTGREGNWHSVVTPGGRTGWAHGSVFSAAPAAPSPAPAARAVRELQKIRTVAHGDNATGVIFELNGYFPPETAVIEGDNPRVVCDFMDVSLARGIPKAMPVDDPNLTGIRIGIHKEPSPKIRVVLDLRPGPNYEVEQVFFKKENYYALVVKTRP